MTGLARVLAVATLALAWAMAPAGVQAEDVGNVGAAAIESARAGLAGSAVSPEQRE